MSNIGWRARFALWLAPEVAEDTERLSWIATHCTAMRPREGDQRYNLLRWDGKNPRYRSAQLRSAIDERRRS